MSSILKKKIVDNSKIIKSIKYTFVSTLITYFLFSLYLFVLGQNHAIEEYVNILLGLPFGYLLFLFGTSISYLLILGPIFISTALVLLREKSSGQRTRLKLIVMNCLFSIPILIALLVVHSFLATAFGVLVLHR